MGRRGDAPETEGERNLKENCTSLREEIRKSEEARLDFLKYKLVAVASLAAVAFGLDSKESGSLRENLRYILALIPFVCIYVDALCYHNNLRIFVIAKYLRCHGDSYEGFLNRWSRALQSKPEEGIGAFFSMEDWVIDYSTWALAVLVMLAGLFPIYGGWGLSCLGQKGALLQGAIIALAGLAGLLLSLFMRWQYDHKVAAINRDSCCEIELSPPSGR